MTDNDDGGKTPAQMNRLAALVVGLVLLMFAMPFVLNAIAG